MIEAQGLTRRYGELTAVRDVSFAVAEGEIVGILGPNGAGKTTTIRMITGFLPPSGGRVTVGGLDLFHQPSKARREIGYLPENVALYPEMRVGEYLRYRARLEGMGRSDGRQAIAEVLDRCLIADVERQIIGTLSKGYRQRVALAAAILHRPSVLVLDEPTVGLDPKQIIKIRELIRELGERRTLLLSTHILPEVEQLCGRVLIIDRGRIVAEGTPEELRREAQGHPQLLVTVKDAPAEAAEVFAALPGATAVTASGENGRLTIDCEVGHDLREAVFRAAVERGWVLLELHERAVSLEDVFVRLTTRDELTAAAADDDAAAEPPAGAAADDDPAAGGDQEVPA
ncbi:MAG: ABC transporter ATP-binding protein [Acidobacteria bacterium]|nr:MAG: ABC transporter ATP-binding protein [Acidobacteriota bacterium]